MLGQHGLFGRPQAVHDPVSRPNAIAIAIAIRCACASDRVVVAVQNSCEPVQNQHWFRSLGFGPDQLTVFVRGLVCSQTSSKYLRSN